MGYVGNPFVAVADGIKEITTETKKEEVNLNYSHYL